MNAFDFLVNKLNKPDAAKNSQIEFNKKRFDNVLDALRTRPVFLPVQIEMPAAIQTLPISGQTNELKYDVIITGAITDGESKKVQFGFHNENTKPFVSTSESGTQISLEAIACKSAESAGVHGIQEFEPFLLRAYEQLNVDIFKPVQTNDVEKVTVCFVGYRVLSETLVNENFDKRTQDIVLSEIAKRVVPQTRFDVCKVVFADNVATAHTSKTDEPRLVWGFRTTAKHANLTIGYDSGETFSKDKFPIWALASEEGNNTFNYRMLKRPIFLSPQEQIFFNLSDTINGGNIANDGQIELLETTV